MFPYKCLRKKESNPWIAQWRLFYSGFISANKTSLAIQ